MSGHAVSRVARLHRVAFSCTNSSSSGSGCPSSATTTSSSCSSAAASTSLGSGSARATAPTVQKRAVSSYRSAATVAGRKSGSTVVAGAKDRGGLGSRRTFASYTQLLARTAAPCLTSASSSSFSTSSCCSRPSPASSSSSSSSSSSASSSSIATTLYTSAMACAALAACLLASSSSSEDNATNNNSTTNNNTNGNSNNRNLVHMEALAVTEADGKHSHVVVGNGHGPSVVLRPKKSYTYIIIGAGTTANAAIESILLMQPDADILLLSNDYPTLWTGDSPDHDVPDFADVPADLRHAYNEWRRHINRDVSGDPLDAYGPSSKVTLLHKKNIKVDVEKHCVVLDDTTRVYYRKCLLAPPGKPRKFYAVDGEKSRHDLKDAINTLEGASDFQTLAMRAEGKGWKEADSHDSGGGGSAGTATGGGGGGNSSGVVEVKKKGSGGGAGGGGSGKGQVQQPAKKKRQLTIIGGGFLGSEIALALARRGQQHGIEVSQVYAESAPMQRILPLYLAKHMQKKLQEAGVKPIKERLVTDIHMNVDEGKVEIVLQGWDKQVVATDYIVLASTHIEADIEIAKESGLELDLANGGIVVNSMLEAMNDLYAAGGAASYYDPALGRRRIDRYDHSVNSGLMAGYNMASSQQAASDPNLENANLNGGSDGPLSGPQPRSYTHQPIIRSQFQDIDVLIEGIGEIDARLRTVGMWVTGHSHSSKGGPGGLRPTHTPGVKTFVNGLSAPADTDPYRRGIVYYLRGERIVGILLWNTDDLLERAREVIRLQPKLSSLKQLKQQIPLAPDDWLRLEETKGTMRYGNEVLTPPF